MEDKMKVLMVDDRPSNLFVLENILKNEDIEIDKAISGNEALSLVLEKEYALVLLDVQMPDIDGFETAELMRGMEKTKHIPIIFVTAINKEKKYVFKGYEVGAIDYIYKPVDPTILRSKVRIFAALSRQKVLLKNQAKELQEKIEELEVTKKQLIDLNVELKILSTIDGLTQIPNRREFDEVINREWKNTKRENNDLSLIILDIDYFKLFNDNYGHVEGDECLKLVAKTLKNCLKNPYDFIFRYGGEEFAVILPNEGIEAACKIAEHIRKNIEELGIIHKKSNVSNVVTVSVGIALMKQGLEIKEFVDQADQALYKAKNAGRNQIAVYE